MSLGSLPRGPRLALLGPLAPLLIGTVGSQSKTTASSGSPISTSAPGSAPAWASASSTPGQPVGQVADRLVVAEIGLQDPAARLFADDEETVLAGPDDLEAGLVG